MKEKQLKNRFHCRGQKKQLLFPFREEKRKNFSPPEEKKEFSPPEEKKEFSPPKEKKEFSPSAELQDQIKNEVKKLWNNLPDYDEVGIEYKGQIENLLYQDPEWGFNETIDKRYQIIKMVLFNRETGKNIPMRKSQEVVGYFKNEGYDDFPQLDEVDESQPQGMKSYWVFKDGSTETWDLFFFVQRL